MKFKKMSGGLALYYKKRGLVGWVMETTNGKWTCDVSRKQTKGKRPIFDTEDEAKKALIEEVGH